MTKTEIEKLFHENYHNGVLHWMDFARALESRVLVERKPVAWAVPQEMAGASFIACCVQGGSYTVPLFTHPTPDDAKDIELRALEHAAGICDETEQYYEDSPYHAGGAMECAIRIRAAIDRARQENKKD